MPDLSEFIGFVSRKSGVNKPALIEQDILIHGLLRVLCKSPTFAGNYLFKGGSCLVKCYFGYYRFSVDLDFTWKDQARFKVGKGELQRRLKTETVAFGDALQDAAGELGLEFRNDPADGRYVEFGGGKRMTTYKLWKGKELVKVQVNFVEELLFPGKYRDNLMANRVAMGVSLGALENPYERGLFIKSPPPSFDKFVDGLFTELREMATRF
jgi:hypothetical protein